MTARHGIPEMAGSAAEGLVELVAAHLRLAGAELIADLRSVTGRLGSWVVSATLFMLGYSLLVVAGGLALARIVGLMGSLLLIGTLHAGAGLLGVAVCTHRLARARLLQRTSQAISVDLQRAGDIGAMAALERATVTHG